MPVKRTTMRKIREILRLRRSAGLSIRQISASTKVSVGAIQKLLAQADALGLGWPLPPELDDDTAGAVVLSRRRHPRLHPLPGARLVGPPPGTQAQGGNQATAVGGIHAAVPQPLLQLLAVLRPLCPLARPAKRSMRQLHKAGEKCFVDYCGPMRPSSVPTPARSIRPRCSWRCWGLPTTPMQKRPSRSPCRTGWAHCGPETGVSRNRCQSTFLSNIRDNCALTPYPAQGKA